MKAAFVIMGLCAAIAALNETGLLGAILVLGFWLFLSGFIKRA